MPRKTPDHTPGSEVIALKALTFLASDEGRFERFIALTGLSLAEIRQRAGERSFLAAVMNHLRTDQSLLLTFAETEGLKPDDVDRAGRHLAGDMSP